MGKLRTTLPGAATAALTTSDVRERMPPMYAYRDASFTYEGLDQWHAEPVRPRRQLVLRFLATVVVLPLWWLLLLVAFVVVFVISLFAEIFTVIPGFERGAERVMDAALSKIVVWPSWAVTWPELRHEGDTDFYRARVDAYLDTRTKRASAAQGEKKAKPSVECEVPLRKYRGVGGAYVIEAAQLRGWELRPSDPKDEIRLWWSSVS
ncbi:hypothetical protein [Streptomyces roseifaciens]|uniref:hypothetical protein n=1 Tax=Streptomyces roseifaciens TaxID=1488406 RepID=UPI000ADB5E34|nr:hypothetical protein [Streptomyces roseifaciens]